MEMIAFLEVSLVSLILRRYTVFKNIRKTQVTLLYWFSVQQQTSALRELLSALSGFFPDKFGTKFNEIRLFYLKALKKGRKMANTKVVQRNANRRRLETKG